jgi:hypothetical protein
LQSESPYQVVLQLREIIFQNNFSKNILLTHKNEAQYIKDIIIQNNKILCSFDLSFQDLQKNIEFK